MIATLTLGPIGNANQERVLAAITARGLSVAITAGALMSSYAVTGRVADIGSVRSDIAAFPPIATPEPESAWKGQPARIAASIVMLAAAPLLALATGLI